MEKILELTAVVFGVVLGFILLIIDFMFRLFASIIIAIGIIVTYIAYVGSNIINLFKRRTK